MTKQIEPFVLTISRQLGSGGGVLGESISARLKAIFLDRQILYLTAKKLKISREDLESLDEKKLSLWKSILLTQKFDAQGTTSEPIFPSDEELFRVEKEIVINIARDNTTVLVGRAGSFMLHDHPRHTSLYLYSNIEIRRQRVQEKYQVTADKAMKMINDIDKTRSHYLRAITGFDWNDARQYHLCLDTGALDLAKIENIVFDYLHNKYGPFEVASIPD